ncbi:MAG TPA: LamG-like jellyroll fold domain-containing protein [Roseimicrobium sp.]|nr:LamG-like jellyroll fold domain-containing protein [Roseimicrobium sp.]
MKHWILPSLFVMTVAAATARAEFKAGAAVVDVTPLRFPVLVNGGMTSRSLDKVKTPVNARALTLADGKEQLVIVVVDSCMMGRELLDEVKALAQKRTGIPTDRMLISATHAHSAPASMGCLGTDADPAYVPYLRAKIVEAIVAAQAGLEPAKIGYAKGNASDFTALRQWILRPDRMAEDPFGNRTVRANMHAGRNWDDVTGEAGPKDPDLYLVSIQSRDGHPLAVLGNFSMHYFSDTDISADYFGLFSEGLKQRIAPDSGKVGRAFVGIMSHGCSGDIWRRDYTKPATVWNDKLSIDDYTKGLLDIAMKAYEGIRYREDVDIAMAETRMTLNYRVPDAQRVEWAKGVMAGVTNRLVKTQPEIYAREQLFLHEKKKTEVVVQALRIGDIGIATTPCETYAVTGLKIKAASPLPHNIVIELANGGDGYIPPPEQHAFGGYNTWAARSAGLEVLAEPKIAGAAIALLEKVSGKPRKEWKLGNGPAADAVLATKPVVYWRMNEFTGPIAADATGRGHSAAYESAITYYLEGPGSKAFCTGDEVNRAPHLVGGRLRAQLEKLGDRYSVSMWVWNGMPNNARDTAGWLFSAGPDHALAAAGDHLGVGGKGPNAGRLVFFHGNNPKNVVAGKAFIPRWQWQNVVLVRDRASVRVYLNGQLDLEIRSGIPSGDLPAECYFGGRSDSDSSWEGRLDEIAVFDRVLNVREISRLQVK